MNNTIGLFGTCGKSIWRDEFIKYYNNLNIPFFNPQVPDGMWYPSMVEDENKHLVNDAIILFPVTNETTGIGSLAEIGFSILASIKRNPDRYFIILIDDNCIDSSATENQIKESIRTRALVKSKVKQFQLDNSGVYLVDTIDDMLALSLSLYDIVKTFNHLHNRFHKVN